MMREEVPHSDTSEAKRSLPSIGRWIFVFPAILMLFGIKARRYLGLSYTSDLFYLLSSSRSYLFGADLFFNPMYGSESWHHNHVLLLFLAPFTIAFDGLGLVLSHALLYGAAFAALARAEFRAAKFFSPVVLPILLGPIALWLIDDPLYGWHTELLYVPLSALFAVGLSSGSRWRVIPAALIVMNREDGAILACSIHCLWTALAGRALLAPGEPNAPPFLLYRRLAVLIASYGLLFLTGFLVLDRWGASERRLIVNVLAKMPSFMSDDTARSQLVSMVRDAVVLLIAGLVAVAPVWSRRAAAFGALFVLPLLCVTIVASLQYYPGMMLYHGVTWPPRFALLWGYASALAIFGVACLAHRPHERQGQALLALSIVAGIASVFLQVFALEFTRRYDSTTVLSLDAADGNLRRLRVEERSLIRCFRDALPREDVAIAGGYLFALLDRQALAPPQALVERRLEPAIVLCDRENRFRFQNGCIEAIDTLPDAHYVKHTIYGLRAAVRTTRAAAVRCLPSPPMPDHAPRSTVR